jgi:hypothetical protein
VLTARSDKLTRRRGAANAASRLHAAEIRSLTLTTALSRRFRDFDPCGGERSTIAEDASEFRAMSDDHEKYVQRNRTIGRVEHNFSSAIQIHRVGAAVRRPIDLLFCAVHDCVLPSCEITFAIEMSHAY